MKANQKAREIVTQDVRPPEAGEARVKFPRHVRELERIGHAILDGFTGWLVRCGLGENFGHEVARGHMSCSRGDASRPISGAARDFEDAAIPKECRHDCVEDPRSF
jgi:hypothetical protein